MPDHHLARADRMAKIRADNERAAKEPGPIRATKSLEVRSRIQVGIILNTLAEHVAGTRNMTATQVTAAKILLDKALPDLHTTTLQTEGGNPITLTISTDDASVL